MLLTHVAGAARRADDIVINDRSGRRIVFICRVVGQRAVAILAGHPNLRVPSVIQGLLDRGVALEADLRNGEGGAGGCG
jgi:hypothetical protein